MNSHTQQYIVTPWHNQLRKFLFNLFATHIIPNNVMNPATIAEQLLNVNTMKVWGEALTPVMFSVNDNLEYYEYIGDATSGVPLRKILAEEGYDESEASSIYQSLNSSEHQWKCSDYLGITPMIRRRYPTQYVNNSIKTDIYEAFLGACDKVGNMFLKGFGQVLCEYIVRYVWEGVFKRIVESDQGMLEGNSKTQVGQLFSRFGLGSPTHVVNRRKDNTFLSSIILADNQLAFLNRNGIPITDPYIARDVQGKTVKASEGKAYIVARQYLNDSYGVNPKWALALKSKLELFKLDPALRTACLDKIKQDGFEKFRFFQHKKLRDHDQQTLILLGIYSDGYEENLQDYTYFYNTDEKKQLNSGDKSSEKVASKKIEEMLRKELIVKYITYGKYPPEI